MIRDIINSEPLSSALDHSLVHAYEKLAETNQRFSDYAVAEAETAAQLVRASARVRLAELFRTAIQAAVWGVNGGVGKVRGAVERLKLVFPLNLFSTEGVSTQNTPSTLLPDTVLKNKKFLLDALRFPRDNNCADVAPRRARKVRDELAGLRDIEGRQRALFPTKEDAPSSPATNQVPWALESPSKLDHDKRGGTMDARVEDFAAAPCTWSTPEVGAWFLLLQTVFSLIRDEVVFLRPGANARLLAHKDPGKSFKPLALPGSDEAALSLETPLRLGSVQELEIVLDPNGKKAESSKKKEDCLIALTKWITSGEKAERSIRNA
eukprot:g16781.t1